MVRAESSASFSKTADFLMSSLGEATERVTSILVVGQACEVRREFQGAAAARTARGCDAYLAAVQYRAVGLGVAPLAGPTAGWGRRAAPSAAEGTGRPAAAAEAASRARVGRHGAFNSTLSGRSKMAAVEGEAA